MKSRLRAFITVVAWAGAVLAPSNGFAWGREGHEIVAAIARDHLDPVVATKAERLLQAAGLPDFIAVASWADTYRFSHPETENFHFTDIPLSASSYNPARDCHGGPGGDAAETCSVAKINDFTSILADPARTDVDRGVALAFLIHLVGDVMQPLHSADNHDRGGNLVHVSFFGAAEDHGRPLNLHAVWDTLALSRLYGKSDPAGIARQIDPGGAAPVYDPDNIGIEVVAWAEESHRYAQSVAYGALPAGRDPALDADYLSRAAPVIQHQLVAAGYRLAGLVTCALRKK